VIGAAVAVHTALGAGFVEGIYHRAFALELHSRGIRFESELRVPVLYKGDLVGIHRLDLLVEGSMVVELKAVSYIIDAHLAQLRSYLKATDTRIGLLLNFNAPVLAVRRVVN
jgi:GxxExxY protein